MKLREQKDEWGEGRKYCPQCQEYKPLEEFGKHSSRPDGRRAICRRCRSAAERRRRRTAAIEAVEQAEREDEDSTAYRKEVQRAIVQEKARAYRRMELAEAEECYAGPDYRGSYWIARYVRSCARQEAEKHDGDDELSAELYEAAMGAIEKRCDKEQADEDYARTAEEAIRRGFRAVLAMKIEKINK